MGSELEAMACALVPEGKGLLAADESSGTIRKRFADVNVESTAENRRAYRELLFATPGIEEFISGVILFDETIRQKNREGRPFPEVLIGGGIHPGIKVDAGTVDLPGFPGEKITEGLDGLRGHLREYRSLGARFTKWRAVIAIGPHLPTSFAIAANAQALARYAALSQEAGLVPIVEPEVLMEGEHTLERCAEVTGAVLESVFGQLYLHRVMLEGLLLKPNMVLPGRNSPQPARPDQVAEATVRCLRRFVPAAVPGVVFLSGGQTPERATENLQAMNALGDHPWRLSFSFSRALQEGPLRAWSGKEDNWAAAQKIFYHRARCNAAASLGRYTGEMEAAA